MFLTKKSLSRRTILRGAGAAVALPLLDAMLPAFVPLAKALRQPMTSDRGRRHWSAVVVEAGTALAAVGVDRLVGTSNVVVRPLPGG